MKEKEEAVLMVQNSVQQGAQQLVSTVMEQAEQRRQEVMESTSMQHEVQVDQMQNQILWLTALIGQDTVAGALNDPAMNAEVMRKAMRMRAEMSQASSSNEEQPLQSQGPMS